MSTTTHAASLEADFRRDIRRDDSMLDRAKRSVRKAERWEAQMDGVDHRSAFRRMRDELLLANAEASIAVAEALGAEHFDPHEPVKLRGSEAVDLGEVQFAPAVPHIAIHVRADPAPREEPLSCTVVLPTDSLCKREEFLDWLRDHGLDPDVVLKVTNVADRYMVVETFKLDAGGRKYVDCRLDEVAMAEPFAVTIHRPMPRGPKA
jgi:hypothetical protein